MNRPSNHEPKGSVLVVDDTPANVRLLHGLLSNRGYQVRVALNGDMALQSIWEQAPDLVLLDVVMPGKNGFDVCRELKEDERSKDVPIIFISSLADTSDKVKAFNSGGVDYVTKPFQPEEVLARVETHLELQQHRRSLQELNKRLIESNQDLEQFAQVASHDMKQPLQVIAGFSELLANKASHVLDDKAKRYLFQIKQGSDRLASLVDSLLDYSRISTRSKPLVSVDLNSVAKEVVGDLGVRIRELNATVTMGHLPQIQADQMQMWQVLRNLVSNGLKFHQPGQTPIVQLESKVQGPFHVISVRDNGIGFDEKHKSKIFQIFRRLEHSNQYEGTGIGLAVCKKIVERHGGTIDVTSTLGEGTTFTFTIPREILTQE